MKILAIDLETTPNLAHIWQLWNVNYVGLNQVIETGEIMSVAFGWLGDPPSKHQQFDINKDNKGAVIEAMWHALDEADVVLHYNGIRFDVPWMNKEFIEFGFHPPSPYVQIDLLSIVRKNFKLPSYKLEFVLKWLKIGAKVKHEGHELWVKCMAGDADAWERMRKYNKGDIKYLFPLYKKLLPYIKKHPNPVLYRPDALEMDINKARMTCKCGSTNLKKNGTHKTQASVWQRYYCKQCGSYPTGERLRYFSGLLTRQ